MTAIKRYRKRAPIEVDAVKLSITNLVEAEKWCEGRIILSGYLDDVFAQDQGEPVGIKLVTKNRLQIAMIGDYIYQDHEGYFHVEQLSEFDFEYEPISDDATDVADTKENNA